MRRPARVVPVASSKCRVSWTTLSPASSTPACRVISYRTARSTERSEFTFLVSERVPSTPESRGDSDRFTSQRSEPWSIRTSETPSARSRSRSAVT